MSNDVPRPEYPRPQWRRDRWTNLNGVWRFAFDDDDIGYRERWHMIDTEMLGADEGPFNREIIVPFAYQTPASGIGDTTLHPVVWYCRTFDATSVTGPGERLLLHVGAADYEASIWVNGQHVASHRGAYTPIEADITWAVQGRNDVLVIRVEDKHDDLAQPRGKQYWRTPSEYIFYRGTTGIWQTVWLEPVARAALEDAVVVPLLDEAAVDITTTVTAAAVGGSLRVTISRDGAVLVRDELRLTDRDLRRRWPLTENLSARDAKMLKHHGLATWHPDNPRLYDLTFELLDAAGSDVDRVESYFGMRSIKTHDGRVLLNDHPLYQRLVLDQGYFPDGGYTAPTDAALRADIELAKDLGFNGARKHQKIEDPRYLYWADRLGFLVWEEMPSAYRYSAPYVKRVTCEWQDVIARDRNHPCIIVWVPMNESWGTPAVARDPDARQEHHLLGLYHLTKALDATRLVVSNDGWEHARTDLCTIHDYGNAAALRERFSDRHRAVESRPLHHPIYVEGHTHRGEPIVVSEFGGIALDRLDTWGMHTVEDGDALLDRYREFVAAVVDSPVTVGFCWTQLTDIEQEATGLLDACRRPKADVSSLRQATSQPARGEARTWSPPPRATDGREP